jgi:hypothetical protein
MYSYRCSSSGCSRWINQSLDQRLNDD